jgi:hypothetical protein
VVAERKESIVERDTVVAKVTEEIVEEKPEKKQKI